MFKSPGLTLIIDESPTPLPVSIIKMYSDMWDEGPRVVLDEQEDQEWQNISLGIPESIGL